MSDFPVESAARARIARKYLQPRQFLSWPGILLGLILGIAGGLYYTWSLNPVTEFDTEPWQLNEDDKAAYIAAITLSYLSDGDLDRAVQRVLSLRLPGDPIQAVAETACRLANSSYVETTTGLQAVRSMMHFYRLQGRSGCADTLISLEGLQPTLVINIQLPTTAPTHTALPSKTATPPSVQPSPTLVTVLIPTSAPREEFVLLTASPLPCDLARSGVIEVYVYALDGVTGLPGQPVRARWNGGESRFFTGLKPERGPAYADFQMSEGLEYTIDMPERSDAVPRPLLPVPCTTATGQRSLTSYRVVFRARAG